MVYCILMYHKVISDKTVTLGIWLNYAQWNGKEWLLCFKDLCFRLFFFLTVASPFGCLESDADAESKTLGLVHLKMKIL